ncbi:hypothetical protein SS50377_23460 [Spironucleus salmonicida]|uniref:SHIPPO 1-like protein n=1 Tax=Spironucleus salmonicida TaxID=348837 RepID=V6LNF7_9EUKA|nr:hypothetical protein SS50377_23460 [Spironucleus salmonicida]|eukprot:EST46197.1 hypothetical protein SS50377_13792 [Spironucleus salmonicida]
MSNIVNAIDLIPTPQSYSASNMRSKRLTQSQLELSTRSLSSSSRFISSVPQKSLQFLTRRRTFADMQIETPDFYDTSNYNSISSSKMGAKIAQRREVKTPHYPSPGRYRVEKSSLSKSGGTIDKHISIQYENTNPGVGKYDILAFQNHQQQKKHGNIPMANEHNIEVTPGPGQYHISPPSQQPTTKISTSRETLPVVQQVFGDLAKSGQIQCIQGSTLSTKNGVIPQYYNRFELPETKNNPAPYNTRDSSRYLKKETGCKKIGEKIDKKISSEEVRDNLKQRKEWKQLQSELQYKNYQQIHNKLHE